MAFHLAKIQNPLKQQQFLQNLGLRFVNPHGVFSVLTRFSYRDLSCCHFLLFNRIRLAMNLDSVARYALKTERNGLAA